MANPREVICIEENERGYYLGPCSINVAVINSEEREFLNWWQGSVRKIMPDTRNPIDGYFIALEDGHSFGDANYIPKPIIANSKDELQEKMYDQAIKLANFISSRYNKPVEDRTHKIKGSKLEAVLQSPE